MQPDNPKPENSQSGDAEQSGDTGVPPGPYARPDRQPAPSFDAASEEVADAANSTEADNPEDPTEDAALRQAESDAPSADLAERLAERTADLQRLQAEYVNYKRRVDRDRDVARKAGTERILADLMPVLDNVRSAREQEEMSEGFKLVAGEIEKLATTHGLEAFGEAGDPFDPRIHEALMQTQADGITEPTAVQVLQVGYRLGERVLRAARVAVAQPADDAAPVSPGSDRPLEPDQEH